MEELENQGFEITGSGYSSVFGSDYSITLAALKNDYIELNFEIAKIAKEDFEEFSNEREAADDKTEYVYNYVKEKFSDNTSSNCSVNYQISDHDKLLQACEDGVCVRYGESNHGGTVCRRI